MKTFRRKIAPTVTAIQFIGDNVDEFLLVLPDATGHKLTEVPAGLVLTIYRPTRNLQLHQGDYLILKFGGDPYDTPQAAFEANYEEVSA